MTPLARIRAGAATAALSGDDARIVIGLARRSTTPPKYGEWLQISVGFGNALRPQHITVDPDYAGTGQMLSIGA